MQHRPAQVLCSRLLQKNHTQTIKLHQKYNIQPLPAEKTLSDLLRAIKPLTRV